MYDFERVYFVGHLVYGIEVFGLSMCSVKIRAKADCWLAEMSSDEHVARTASIIFPFFLCRCAILQAVETLYIYISLISTCSATLCSPVQTYPTPTYLPTQPVARGPTRESHGLPRCRQWRRRSHRPSRTPRSATRSRCNTVARRRCATCASSQSLHWPVRYLSFAYWPSPPRSKRVPSSSRPFTKPLYLRPYHRHCSGASNPSLRHRVCSTLVSPRFPTASQSCTRNVRVARLPRLVSATRMTCNQMAICRPCPSPWSLPSPPPRHACAYCTFLRCTTCARVSCKPIPLPSPWLGLSSCSAQMFEADVEISSLAVSCLLTSHCHVFAPGLQMFHAAAKNCYNRHFLLRFWD